MGSLVGLFPHTRNHLTRFWPCGRKNMARTASIIGGGSREVSLMVLKMLGSIFIWKAGRLPLSSDYRALSRAGSYIAAGHIFGTNERF